MGSPISGVIDEALLQRLEQEVLPHCQPKFWERYVDGTFVVVVVERNRVDMLWDQLNSIFPDILFTRELEQNNEIAFLGVLVTREESGRLTSSVYKKSTTTTKVSSTYLSQNLGGQRCSTSCSSLCSKASSMNPPPPIWVIPWGCPLLVGGIPSRQT